MGASVLSKVTPVSQEASLLLSRSKADCVCILFMGCVAVMEMSGAGADVALLLSTSGLSLVFLAPSSFRRNKCIGGEQGGRGSR